MRAGGASGPCVHTLGSVGFVMCGLLSCVSMGRFTRHLRSAGSELGKPLAHLTSSKFEHIPGGEALCPPPSVYALLQAVSG